MRRIPVFPALVFVSLFALAGLYAQETKPQAGAPESPAVAAPAAPAANPLVAVPRLIKFSGTLEDMAAKPITGVAEVTFAIYREQAGGDPLWFETQRVEADALGRYTVLLGAMSAQGLPAELFTSTAAHWLGVQVANLPESAQGGRILLVSVPYALKALDAETLGGKPASAFQLVAPESAVTATGPASKTGSGSANLKTPTGKGPTPQVTSGTTGFIGKFVNSTDLGNSELFDTGTAIGLGTQTPAATLDLLASGSRILLHGSGTHQIQVTGATSGRLGQDSAGFFFASDTNGAAVRFLTNNGALHEWMRITAAGNVGIGTTAPAYTLEVKGATTGLAATVNSVGGVAAVFDNAAGGKVLSARNNGVEKLSVDSGGNLTTLGGVTASLFSGSGSGLVSLNAANLTGTVPVGDLPSSLRTRAITYLGGCDNCGLLQSTDSQRQFYVNLVGAMTINSVTCFSDAGSPQINIARDNAGPTNLLSSNLTCSTSGAITTSFVSSALNLNDQLDFVMASADGVARRVTVVIQAILN